MYTYVCVCVLYLENRFQIGKIKKNTSVKVWYAILFIFLYSKVYIFKQKGTEYNLCTCFELLFATL